MADKKKYTLIELDTGLSECEERTAELSGTPVKEETIVVSSAGARPFDAARDGERVFVDTTGDGGQKPSGALVGEVTRNVAEIASEQAEYTASQDDGEDEDDTVPFRRMQTVIIVCLIVVIVAFLVYFNFLR